MQIAFTAESGDGQQLPGLFVVTVNNGQDQTAQRIAYGDFKELAWSPVDSRLLYRASDDIYVIDMADPDPTQNAVQLTVDPDPEILIIDRDPAWSPDGIQIQ